MRRLLLLVPFITFCSAAALDHSAGPHEVRQVDQAGDEEQGSEDVESESLTQPVTASEQVVPELLPAERAILAADVPRRVEDSWGGSEAIIPFQRWPQVPGHVVGVLFAAGAQPWGGSIGWGRGIGENERNTPYWFGFDGSSPYAIYFLSDGRGHNFMRQWSVPTLQGSFSADVAMFGPATPNEWGLRRRAHLVELEVNEGQGASQNNLHFIVTDARVIDETSRFPVAMEAVLGALRGRFDRIEASYHNGREQLMAQLLRSYQQQNVQVLDDLSARVGFWPSWHRQDGTLEVYFLVQQRRTIELPAPASQSRCPACVPPRPCAPCRQPPPPRPIHRSVGIEMAAAFVVNRDGQLIRERVYPPRLMD